MEQLNSIFALYEEMIRENGEDCFYHDVAGDRFIIAAFDGCGGSGAKKYDNYSGKTGAYVASRAVCGGVNAWFRSGEGEDRIMQYVQDSIRVCEKYADKAGRFIGSLGKAFPTTAAIIIGEKKEGKLEITCIWAGDSRCYLLEPNGLHQLTNDDLDGQDAMSNLLNDGVMTNVINASTPFCLHCKKLTVKSPCILLSATDGCFGYLKSPMEFEYLLTDSLVRAENPFTFKMLVNERIHRVAGDDFTLCTAIFGFRDFADLRAKFAKRNQLLAGKYVGEGVDPQALWEEYKTSYSAYL